MKERGFHVRALTLRFFHVAQGEMAAARAIGEAAGVEEHRFVELPDMKEASDLKRRFDGLPPSYIPMRNSVFYGVAAGFAEEVGAGYIVGGHNGEDAKVFRDVGEAFFRPLQDSFRAGSELLEKKRLAIVRPLSSMTKPRVIKLAEDMGVPLELTWSCHEDGKAHCWRCTGCRGRRDAFARAGIRDPLAPGPNAGKIS